jgi:hypothetical protein
MSKDLNELQREVEDKAIEYLNAQRLNDLEERALNRLRRGYKVSLDGLEFSALLNAVRGLQRVQRGAAKIILDLLGQLELYKAEDYPRTCGACGMPDACCDTDCMTAAYMSEHDIAIRRARYWLDQNRRCE